jgi:hypothetical protein
MKGRATLACDDWAIHGCLTEPSTALSSLLMRRSQVNQAMQRLAHAGVESGVPCIRRRTIQGQRIGSGHMLPAQRAMGDFECCITQPGRSDARHVVVAVSNLWCRTREKRGMTPGRSTVEMKTRPSSVHVSSLHEAKVANVPHSGDISRAISYLITTIAQ